MENNGIKNKSLATNSVSVLDEFKKHFILIISLVIVGGIVLDVARPEDSGNAIDTFSYVFGQIIGLFLIPFVLSFLSMIFVKSKEKRPKIYYHTFLVLLAIVFIQNLRWVSMLKNVQ